MKKTQNKLVHKQYIGEFESPNILAKYAYDVLNGLIEDPEFLKQYTRAAAKVIKEEENGK